MRRYVLAFGLALANACANSGAVRLQNGPRVMPGEAPEWYYREERHPQKLSDADSMIVRAETVHPDQIRQALHMAAADTIRHILFGCGANLVTFDLKHIDSLDLQGIPIQKFTGLYHEGSGDRKLKSVRLAIPAARVRKLLKTEVDVTVDEKYREITRSCLRSRGLISG